MLFVDERAGVAVYIAGKRSEFVGNEIGIRCMVDCGMG